MCQEIVICSDCGDLFHPHEINRVYLKGRRSEFFICDDCIELQIAEMDETQEIELA